MQITSALQHRLSASAIGEPELAERRELAPTEIVLGLFKARFAPWAREALS